jgi:hypothetical protein
MKLRMLVIFGLMIAVLSFGPIKVFTHAQEEQTTETTQTQEATEAEINEKFNQRIQERKTEFRSKLTFAKQARIKTVCKSSQGKLSKIQGRINGLETSRSKVYANLIQRLESLSTKLEDKNVDTTELKSQIAELNILIATFNTDLADYKQAVSDLAEMDCQADAAGFQASLEAAREARAKTAESAKAIRTYLTETIKPTLKEIRQQLNSDTSSEDTTEGGAE